MKTLKQMKKPGMNKTGMRKGMLTGMKKGQDRGMEPKICPVCNGKTPCKCKSY